jgi:hypothetical protein
MKQVILKITILALYVVTGMVLFSFPGVLTEVFGLAALFVYGYCGIIVLAHLLATFRTLCRYCVAARRETRDSSITAPAVEFVTETEAT